MTRESYVEGSCKRWAESQGWLLLKLWPVLRGLPDRILLRPGGRIDFVEFKRPGGRATPSQLWWRDKLLALGFSWRIVDSLDQFKLHYGLTDTKD